jgi:RNA polymerase sigma factor (sigma-70 family)
MQHPDNDAVLVALIDQMAAANEGALKDLYGLTSAKLYGVALRVLGKAEWAEDVLQESFLYIWRSAPFYRASRSPPMAWMSLIVKSRAIDFQRHLTVEKQHLMNEMTEDLEQHLAADTPTALDLRHASQAAIALHACLSALERPQREVVSLAYLKELSHGELADRLKLPLGTVKSWIRRSLDQLRRCMAHYA